MLIGYVQYNVTHTSDKGICQVTLKDDLDNVVAQFEECVEVIFVPKAQPWWPAHCGQSPVGYLYSLQVSIPFRYLKLSLYCAVLKGNGPKLFFL